MDRIKRQRAEKIFSDLGSHQIMILGDVMLDEYMWGNVSRISPEAPVPVVEVFEETTKLGGAGNVALNISALEDIPILVGVIGDDLNGEKLKTELSRQKISVEGIIKDRARKTTTKTRIIAQQQQVVRADREDTEEISQDTQALILDYLRKKIDGLKGIIISDYGKGVVTFDLLTRVISLAKKNNVIVGVDPKETHFMNYKEVTVITPNHHEASFVAGKRIKDEKSLEEVGWKLLNDLKAESLLITRGKEGMSLFEKDNSLTHFPTRAKKVFDVTGAGDTVISTFVSALASGADFKEASFLSNHAAGIAVGELGAAQVTKKQLYQEVKGFVE
jgi:rfaE bifunctional protein kinase chain/domain